MGAFVLAGVDAHAGSEADFFADRVRYYDQGVMGHEQTSGKINKTLTLKPVGDDLEIVAVSERPFEHSDDR